MKIFATIALTVLLAGCGSPAAFPLNPQSPILEPDTFVLENQTGPIAVKFYTTEQSTCSINIQAQVRASTPQWIWAFLTVPTADADWLGVVGLYQTHQGIAVAGNAPLTAPSSDSFWPLNVTFDIDVHAAEEHYIILGNVEVPEGELSHGIRLGWSCGESSGLEVVGWGNEVLTTFFGMDSMAGISLNSPEVVEVSIRGSEIRDFNSPQVQLIVGASGDRAGILRLTLEGVDELHPMQNLQVIERHGGPGRWGISEDGVHTISWNHYGFVLGIHPVEIAS